MAFAAAVAAGAAGHSSSCSSCDNSWITGGLIALSLFLACFTLAIERMSGTHYKYEHEVNASKLDLIKTLPEISTLGIIY